MDQLFERYHRKLEMIDRAREKATRGVEARDVRAERDEGHAEEST